MFWDDLSGATSGRSNKKKKEDALDAFEVTEMCDVCCKSYYTAYISRIKYINAQGIVFTIRKCPFCNVNDYAKYL